MSLHSKSLYYARQSKRNHLGMRIADPVVTKVTSRMKVGITHVMSGSHFGPGLAAHATLSLYTRQKDRERHPP